MYFRTIIHVNDSKILTNFVQQPLKVTTFIAYAHLYFNTDMHILLYNSRIYSKSGMNKLCLLSFIRSFNILNLDVHKAENGFNSPTIRK